MSWKRAGQRYHGYSDDIILLAIGIEDKKIGVIDVLASSLFKETNIS